MAEKVVKLIVFVIVLVMLYKKLLETCFQRVFSLEYKRYISVVWSMIYQVSIPRPKTLSQKVDPRW